MLLGIFMLHIDSISVKHEDHENLVFSAATSCSGYGSRSHYIFALCFLLSSSFFFLSIFFPRLISAVADCMYTILPRVALVRILDAGLKRDARGSLKYRTQKNRQKFAISAPSHNFVGLYIRN